MMVIAVLPSSLAGLTVALRFRSLKLVDGISAMRMIPYARRLAHAIIKESAYYHLAKAKEKNPGFTDRDIQTYQRFI